MLIIGVDVGSVRRSGGFSWATLDGETYGQDRPGDLGDLIVKSLWNHEEVAVAFECPLTVPVPSTDGDLWRDLGKARDGEGNRSWSAGAGTGALATGLVQLAWLCRYVQDHTVRRLRVSTQVPVFRRQLASLLIAEALVSSSGKPEPVDGQQDQADAVAAAKRLYEILASDSGEHMSSDVRCAPHRPLNLAAVCALHAGMDIDPAEIGMQIAVAKARPVLTSEVGRDERGVGAHSADAA